MIIVGVDEAGRGPLFGPVVAAAVVLKEDIENLDDSKKLSSKLREELFEILKQKSYYAIGIASPEEIDKLNILHATELAMNRALESLKLKVKFDIAYVDGKNLKLKFPSKCFVRGDSYIKEISAASIIAKVVRDKIIEGYSKVYKIYKLDIHKGYPTKMHIELIKKFGITPLHRLTFKPVIKTVSIQILEEWYKNGIIDEERYLKIIKKMGVPLFGIQNLG
ncbi:ribonuclease HII [Thermosipho atlanticus]|uniref:Ribonuclease HII n=1 Tax=Thermosipho atlanticus DSM 15807 TaxID=1123380 RepID=A0A1M5SIT6_9BACT|nr:ribonuclease HII [Thermosipho atlanticus]SHH37813.1 RNase HII [Thermosipho atlanticus DSM 15807]